MGQYHYLCNLTKKEYLHPHKFGEGLKQVEFSSDRLGILLALSYLLSFKGEARGGGDFVDGANKGRWHGDSISMIGDYAEDSDNPNFKEGSDNPHKEGTGWTDISMTVLLEIIRNEYHVAETYYKYITDSSFCFFDDKDKKSILLACAKHGFGNVSQPIRDSKGRFARKLIEV